MVKRLYLSWGRERAKSTAPYARKNACETALEGGFDAPNRG